MVRPVRFSETDMLCASWKKWLFFCQILTKKYFKVCPVTACVWTRWICHQVSPLTSSSREERKLLGPFVAFFARRRPEKRCCHRTWPGSTWQYNKALPLVMIRYWEKDNLQLWVTLSFILSNPIIVTVNIKKYFTFRLYPNVWLVSSWTPATWWGLILMEQTSWLHI